MQRATGGQLLVAALATEGVEAVFGLPGVQLDPLMDGMYAHREQIDFFSVRHEQAATYLADGYARVSGQPGVAMVVPGPGILNASAGLATAYACSSPVLLLSGSIESHMLGRGLGALHEIAAQTEILRSLTKWSAAARHPGEITGLVHEAFYQLRSDRPGPVALEVPPDVLAAVTDGPVGEPLPTRRVMPDPPSVAAVAELLRHARRPLILAGGGAIVADAGAALVELAELLGAPIVLSRNGRGCVDARNPLVFDPLALRYLKDEADVVLAIGTRLGSSDGGHTDVGPGRLVMVNVDRGTFRYPRPAQSSIYGDAALTAAELTARLQAQRPTTDDHGWGQSLQRTRVLVSEQLQSVAPQLRYLEAIRSALPDEAVFVTEYTQVGYVASIAFPTHRPRGFISPGYQGTLGYGFATALGAQVAAGTAPVICVTGDGGFSWTMPELSTARKYDIPVTVVVFTDGFYFNVRRMQRELWEGHYIGTDLCNPDFLKLADSFGIPADRATTPQELGSCLRAATGTPGPHLIEVPVGEFPSPWSLIDAL